MKRSKDDNDSGVEFGDEVDEDDCERPTLSIVGAVLTLLVSLALIGFNGELATNSIQALVNPVGLSPTLIGIAIVPIINADIGVVTLAMKEKMDDSIALTLEKCMQTALLIIPLIIITAWGMGIENMSMDFDGFAAVVMFTPVILVTFVIEDGRTNWLVGALLVKVYVIVALAAFFVP